MTVAKRILRYLKGHHGQGLFMKSDFNLRIVAYCDSDWGAGPIIRRSLTGYFVTFGGSTIFLENQEADHGIPFLSRS